MTQTIYVPVFHPDYGFGRGEHMSEGIDGQPLLFIRWTTDRSGGVAGGWYDPMDERLCVESAVLLAAMYERDIKSA